MSDGYWIGGGESSVVATDARNATPISVVATTAGSVTTVSHSFSGKELD